MAKRRTKAEIQLEAKIDSAFKQYGANHQFDMMDLGKMFDEVRAQARRTSDNWQAVNGSVPVHILYDEVDTAMQTAVAKYSKGKSA